MKGVIISILEAREAGFIKAEDGNGNLFFRLCDADEDVVLEVGTHVECVVMPAYRNRRRAVHVKVGKKDKE